MCGKSEMSRFAHSLLIYKRMKVSNYNILVDYSSYKIMYNTLSNSIVCFTKEEYGIIIDLFKKLEEFEKTYPKLFKGLKSAGFIIDDDFDELNYIKLRNNLSTFGSSFYHLTINPTLDCNLKCWYCSTEYANAKHSGEMTEETILAVKKHIQYLIKERKAEHLHLDWFGGEPLMYFGKVIKPISEEAISLCDSNHVRFSHHITTNSVYMTDKMIHDFVDLRLNSFQIPLDGNEHHHNKIKYNEDRSGTFKTIINNLNLLADIIPDVKITLRINYDKKTLYGIEDIIPLLSEKAKKHIVVDFQRVWQVACDENDKAQLKKVKREFMKNGLNSDFWAYQPGIFNRCYADRFHQYAINYDGRIFKCTAQDYGDDKVVGRLNNDGSVNWNISLLSELFAHSTFDNEKCLTCKILPICMGPCIIKNYKARKEGKPIPCILDNTEFPLNSFIIEESIKRGLIKYDSN